MRIKQEKLLEGEINPPKKRQKSPAIKSYFVDKKEKWAIIANGSIVSKHISLYHAQTYIPKLHRKGVLLPGDDYKIETIS